MKGNSQFLSENWNQNVMNTSDALVVRHILTGDSLYPVSSSLDGCHRDHLVATLTRIVLSTLRKHYEPLVFV